MAAIDTMTADAGAAVYYTEGLRDVLEDHMTYLRGLSTTQKLDVPPILLHRFEHDLPGLLNQFRIPPFMHWTVMRLNGLDSLSQVPEDLLVLYVPDGGEITKIQQTYSTTLR